jgi:chemotaxis protein histidine kinase CheA
MNESTILDRAEASGYPVPRRDMTRDRVLQYIFLPGFTTKITRPGIEAGMGLDVVSDAVSRMGGAITVQSEPGQGTAFTIRMPVALMTLPSRIVATPFTSPPARSLADAVGRSRSLRSPGGGNPSRTACSR